MSPDEQQRHDQFLQLYVAHEEALRGFVRGLVPTREDAREVMQETAAILWRKFGELTGPEEFRRWAFGVARFEALAFARDRARDRHVFSEELIEALAHEHEENADEFAAERVALERCVQKLDATQRALVREAYAPGARIGELAERSGRTAMALYKTLHRVRLALAECARRVLAEEGLA
jgi:RNA polymerase sigma-70 factor (ECF subfamily)